MRLWIVLLLFTASSPLFSQIKDEGDLKKAAASAFEDEDYPLAYKHYSTLVANYPKDPEYNYRLGVCAIFVERDKKKPLAYLQIAARSPKEVEKEVFFYLGKVYHINYQFDEAIKHYTQYKLTGSSSMQKKLQVDREIQCCKNGKRLLSNVKELVILDKKELNQTDYFRSYDLKDIRGKLLAKPSDFTSPNDKKKKDRSIIYLPASKDQLYYASYGTGDNKDIYLVSRLPSGEWGKPQPLGKEINTEYDEDFPFLHPNGMVLYFASKGHNSMGGYDVFKSEWDDASQKWKSPVNLDFPINSPSDDYLFVTDSLEKIAFLASTRQTPAGKVDVYRILTERRPAEYAFIRGSVAVNPQLQSRQAKIKVKNIETGEDVGTFVAETNGEYNIKLTNGGKFIFTVETPGMPTQSEGVTVPTAYNYKPYRQTVEYDQQKLVITNFFNTDENDENNYQQYLALIEEKAKMSVNASDFDINPNNPVLTNTVSSTGTNTTATTNTVASTNTTVTTNTTTAATNTTTTAPTQTNTAHVSNKQLVDMAYNDAKELQQEATELKKDATTAFTAANSKQDQANETKQELQEVQTKLNSETDPAKKQELSTQADKLKQEADLYDKQAKTANTIAQQLEVDANNKQKEADLNLQYAKALEEADQTKNNKQAIAKLESLQKQLEDLSKQKSQSNALVESIKADAQNKENELKNAEKKQVNLDREENDIKSQITELDKEIEKTKDKNLLDNLKAQKEELNTDLADKQKESKLNQSKIATLKDESDALKSQAEYAANLANGNATEPVATNTTVSTSTTVATNTVATTGTNTVATTVTNTVSTTATNTVAATNTISVATNTVSTTATNTTSTTSSNTVAAVDTNTTTATTNTVATTNTIALSAFQERAKQYDENISELNNSGNTLDNNRKKLDVLNQYLQATDAEIKEKKQQLAKAKNADDKARLNEEIKQLTDKKTDLQTDVRLVSTQVKEQEKQATIAAAKAKQDSINQAKTGVATTTIKDTSETRLQIDNSDPRIQNINSLIGLAQNNFSEEKKIFSMEYTDPKALQSKKQADDKLDALLANNTALEQQLEQLKIDIAKENSASNDKKIQDLLKKADALNAEALQLRRDAKTMAGAEKQAAFNKIMSLEKEASGFKYQAARLQYQSDDNNYETNKQAITQLTSKENPGPEAQQAKEISLQADKIKKEAVRLREEAEAQSEVEAKIGALSNADEKEKEALKKQEEALALLKKGDGKTPTADLTHEKQINELKNKLSKENTQSVNALRLLYDANKAEYTALLNDLNATEKKTGSKPEELALKEEVQKASKQAADELAKLGQLKDDAQKREALLAINTRMQGSISQLKNAKSLLTGEPVVVNTATVTSTNTVSATASNTVAATNTVSTTNTNTTSVASNTVSAVNTNTTGIAATNTVALTDEQATQVKSSPEYKNYATLQTDLIKNNNQAIQDESAARESQRKYDQVKQEVSGMPEGDAKKQKQKELDLLELKNDSLQQVASTSRTTANNKKQEADRYLTTLDKTTANNITTVAATDTKIGSMQPPKKYSNYSPTFQNSANQKDEQLASLRSNTGTPENLKQQNQIIDQYLKDIDTEVETKKQEQNAATDPEDKIKLAQQIKNLQTRKLELTNEKNSNENIIRFASNNTATTNTTSTGTNTVSAVNTNTVASTNTNTVSAINTNTTSAVATNTTASTNPNIAASNLSPTIKANGFEVKRNNAYSNANPIPVNEKLPDGLVFRVQIGAFKNPIEPSRFAGLAPIGAESTNFGFIRYQVGMFDNYQRANAVKNDMRKLKYTDAFVVAYLNGKRIPLSDALDSLAGKGQDITPNANSSAGITANSNIPVNPEPNTSKVVPVTSGGDLNTFNGAFYTIQVGVYSNNVSAAGLLNVSPIFKEALPTGYYRYTAGIYSNFEKVNSDRERVVGLGIKDAFVSGYVNGKRVVTFRSLDSTAGKLQFLAERPIIFPEGGAAVNTNTLNLGIQPSPTVQPFNNGVTEGPTPTPENGVKASEEGITYKVQIGAYRKQVPQEVANNWLKVKTWPVKYTTLNDLYIYTIGQFTDSNFAKKLREEVIALGITDAFVVVFKDGKKLFGPEAAQYLNR